MMESFRFGFLFRFSISLRIALICFVAFARLASWKSVGSVASQRFATHWLLYGLLKQSMVLHCISPQIQWNVVTGSFVGPGPDPPVVSSISSSPFSSKFVFWIAMNPRVLFHLQPERPADRLLVLQRSYPGLCPHKEMTTLKLNEREMPAGVVIALFNACQNRIDLLGGL